MSEWRHVEQGDGRCWATVPLGTQGTVTSACGCPSPSPDPTSPCGHREGGPSDLPCGALASDGWHDRRTWEQDPELWHPHVPTRCADCGHPIERVP